MNSVAKNDRLRSTGLSRVDIKVLLHFHNSSSLSKFPSPSHCDIVPEGDFMRVILKKNFYNKSSATKGPQGTQA
jgi:hypothetical protein